MALAGQEAVLHSQHICHLTGFILSDIPKAAIERPQASGAIGESITQSFFKNIIDDCWGTRGRSHAESVGGV